MRNLTTAAQTLIQQKLGLEAIVIVQIAWNGVDFVSYADRDYEGIPGKILEMGNLDDVRNLAGTGSNAQVSIKLDDTDGTIKAMMDQYDVQKMPIIFLQTFATLGLSDAFVIFRGAIVTPIMWSEQRTVSVEAITHVESVEVGFSPEEAQFQNVSPSLWSKVWPLAFGDCLHIPAVKSWERLRGATATGLGIVDYTLPYKYAHLIDRLATLSNGFDYYLTCINSLRALINTAPIDLSNLLTNINFQQVGDVAASVDPLMIEQINANTTGNFANATISYLGSLNVPQLYGQAGIIANGDTSGEPNNTTDNLTDALDVLNQMELSYAQIIVTQQALKQDHEDLANFIHVFDKTLDKFNNLLQNVPGGNPLQTFMLPGQPTPGQPAQPATAQQRYLAIVQGIINYLQNQLVSTTQGINDYVTNNIIIPTPQTQLFTTMVTDPQLNQSQTLQVLIQICQSLIQTLQTLMSNIQGTQSPTQWKMFTQIVATDLTTTANQQKVLINTVTNNLEQLKGVKERLEIDMDNCEYAYKTIRDINKKLYKDIKEFQKTMHEVYKVQRAITEQSLMPTSTVQLSDNNLFPQGELRLSIKDMIFAGELEDNEFTVIQIQPKYMNIKIGPRLSNEIDAFWITDPTIILKGCYCLYPFPSDNDQFNTCIFKVKEQYGTKCIIDLIEAKERAEPREPKQQTPTLQTLPNYITDLFTGAHAHTRNEIVKILENSLEKYETELLRTLRTTLEKLTTLAGNSTTTDQLAVVNETITKDINEYNSRVNNLHFKKEAVTKCLETISDHEKAQLLKVENLKINIGIHGIDNEPTQILPGTRMYHITGYDIIGAIPEASPHMLPSWYLFEAEGQALVDLNGNIVGPDTDSRLQADFLPQSAYWYAPPGSEVYVVDATQEKYIVNILPSQVVAVYGKTAVDGIEQLVPLPQDTYTVNEYDTSYQDPAIVAPEFVPLAVTSITLVQPLSAYNLGFDGQVYVSVISTVGPNTAEIIAWIVETWTNLNVDPVSFSQVEAILINYPQSFCLLQKKDALKLIEQIAWENRCACYIKNEVVYLQYLAQAPTTVDTITETDVEDKSLSYELTNTEDIVTKFIARWRADYAIGNQPFGPIFFAPSPMPGEAETIVRYNISKYGLWPRTYQFETFNLLSLVIKSSTFWSIRYANVWKRVKFKTFLHKLALETFDWVILDFAQSYFSDGPIVGLIEKADYDSATNTISIQCWVPIRSGEMTLYPFAMPAGLAIDTIYPPISDIVLGLAGNFQNSAVPTDAPYQITPNDNLVEKLELRPKDYGDLNPSDAADSLPPSPLSGLSISDYMVNMDVLNYNLPPYPRVRTPNQGRPGIGFDGMNSNTNGSRYGATQVGGQTGDTRSDTPMRQTFQGRVTQVVDPTAQSYLVQTTDGYQYTVEQSSGTQQALSIGQVVTAHRDIGLNRYTTLDQPISSILKSVVILSILDDFLYCDDGNGNRLYAIKSYTLQRTPWDAQTVTLNGLSVTLNYSSASVRVATDSNGDTETQVIVPDYVVNEWILVFATSPTYNDVSGNPIEYVDPAGNPISYVDMNQAGRAWASQSS